MAEHPAGDPRIGVTNNERAETKHLVQPYSDAPVVDETSDRACAFCGNTGFRRSRLRFTDLLQLVMLKLPVRCVRCGQRQHVALSVAAAAQAAKAQTIGPSPDKPGSWKKFTEDAPSTLLHARPATTAAVPVAERLDDAFKPGPPAHLGTTEQTFPAPVGALAPSAERPAAQPVKPTYSAAPPARTPSRRSDDSGIW